MNCTDIREAMIDVLYGEESDSRRCFDFFRHMDSCTACTQEYLELVRTREILAEWEVDEEPEAVSSGQNKLSFGLLSRLARRPVLSLVGNVAAAFLIVVGGLSILQSMGFFGGPHVAVSQPELAQMVNDMIVQRQDEERQLIGMALVRLKEETDLQRRQDMREVYNHLVSLQERYLDTAEENKQYLRQLVSVPPR
ncbi:MAG: anti-sigma factor family protein [Acidobacteriota bacterium]